LILRSNSSIGNLLGRRRAEEITHQNTPILEEDSKDEGMQLLLMLG
jgi:hypothetical protein